MNQIFITLRYLKEKKVQIPEDRFKIRMESHPDYPSILSITDTLTEFGINFQAVQVDEQQIDELSFPLIAAVPHIKAGIQILYNKEEYIFLKEKLRGKFRDIVIMIPENQVCSVVTYSEDLQTQRTRKRLTYAVTFLLSFSLLVLDLIQSNLYFFLLDVLSLCGLYIALLITHQKSGKRNRLIDALCPVVTSSCGAVTNSSYAKLTKWLDVADLAVMYFTTLLMFRVSSWSAGSHYFFSILIPLLALSLLVAGISVFIQWYVIKSWCKFCLLISAFILLQALTGAAWISKNSLVFGNSSFSLLIALGISALLSFIWLAVKESMTRAATLLETETELFKWKRDYSIFIRLLKYQPLIDTDIPGNAFAMTEINPVKITIVAGPECRPCSAVHHEIKSMYERNPSIVSLNVIFAFKITSDQDNSQTRILKSLFTHASSLNAFDLLDEWYGSMNFASWTLNHPSIYSPDAISQMKAHLYWCNKNDIHQTPTIFINGRQLPQRYKIADIESFLFELAEDPLLNQQEQQPVSERY